MNMNRILQNLCTLAATLLLAACTQNELADLSQGDPLPEGMYPMTFTTVVDGLTMTRAATADGQWTAGDVIAVQVGSGVKRYTPANINGASATLQAVDAVNTFYWQTSNETKTVSAWYYGTGYNATPPTSESWSWAVQSDQNANDGYRQSDFLYAPATDITFANKNSTSLTFYHQTAKVVINIKNADAATDANQIISVVIGHDNKLALKGVYSAPTGTNTIGSWTPATAASDKGTIISKKQTAGKLADGTTIALASYAALVIPQDMTGEKFIAVTLSNDNTYYYTPTGTAGDLKAGQQHTYDITVKNGYLEVTAVSGGTSWGDGGEVNVTGVYLLAEYAPDKLKIGDYYYSDGSTSDGGLRAIYSDGSTEIENIGPVLTDANGTQRNCVGIVFCTDKNFIETQSTNKTVGGYTNALVVALKETGIIYNWDNRDNAVIAYKEIVSAPTGSSGWYVPNKEELMYICRGSNYNSESVDGRDMLHAQFDKLESTDATYFGSANYWSSTEYSSYSDGAFDVGFDDGYVGYSHKDDYCRVRCVLAF